MNPTESANQSGLGPQTKKILAIIGAIAALLLAAFFIYNVLVTPAKQPYRDALSQYKNVYNANIAFTNSGTGLNSSSASDEQFIANVATVNAALAALEKENEALGTEAVLTDGEGKDLYAAFDTQLQAYVVYNENILASIEKIRPTLYACSQKMTNITEDAAGVEAMRSCATNFEEIEDVPDADYKALVGTLKVVYADFATNLQAVADLQDPKGADKVRYEQLLEERTDILNTLNTASTTLAENLQLHRNEVDITLTAQALDEYLQKKSSIF